MHPPAGPFGQPDRFGSHPHTLFHSLNQPRGSGTLDFAEQFQRSRPDYFNVKSVRGSSPAASLAADLCQNFHIDNDASPHFPTPRRALFTTSTIMNGMEAREYVTTPPLPPSSSPGYMDMDISPLPNKAPAVAQIEVHSPTPVPTPDEDDEMDLESPVPAPRHAFLEPPKPIAADRRKMGLRRPSLTRTKGYSTGTVPYRSNPEQLPLFKFGGESRLGSSSLSLSECFGESPPQERRPQTSHSPSANVPGALRSKAHFASLSGASAMRTGSPITTAHARRPSNPFNRPRRQFRRSLSMFENPADMVKPKEPSPPPSLQAVVDVEEPAEPILPHFFPEGQNDSIPRITRTTFLEILDGRFNENYDQKIVIDCRFEYEYEGGHIDGAINYNDKDLLSSHLFETPMEGRTLLILHCEYSAHRAPLMARHVRAQDRAVNAEFYPKLTYPEVYILDGGYSGFFSEHRERCYPQAYVEMDAAEHAFTCEREMGKLRQNRKGLSRAATFAFGQQDRQICDSPTGPSRSNTCDSSSPMAIGASPCAILDRGHARRMASY